MKASHKVEANLEEVKEEVEEEVKEEAEEFKVLLLLLLLFNAMNLPLLPMPVFLPLLLLYQYTFVNILSLMDILRTADYPLPL